MSCTSTPTCPICRSSRPFVKLLTAHLGYPIPSPAIFDKIGTAFRRAVARFADDEHIPVVRFTKADRKIENDNPIWPHCDGLIWPHPGSCGDGRRSLVVTVGGWGGGSGGGSLLRGAGGAQPVGVGAGGDDVGAEGEPVDHGGGEAGVGEGGPHSENGALLAQAMEAFSSRAVMIWNSSSAPRGSRWT